MAFPFGFLSKLFRVDPVPHKRRIEAGAGGSRWQGAGHLHAPQQATLAARGPVCSCAPPPAI